MADETNPKRLLMKNRFGFNWLTIGFLKLVDSHNKPNQNKLCIKSRALPVPTCLLGQGGLRKRMRPYGNQAGLNPLDEGFFMPIFS